MDLTAQALVDPDLYRRTLIPLLADDAYAAFVFGIIQTDPATAARKFPPITEAVTALKPDKPVIFAGLDDGAPVPPDYIAGLRALGVTYFPSPDRAFRALRHLTGGRGAIPTRVAEAAPIALDLPPRRHPRISRQAAARASSAFPSRRAASRPRPRRRRRSPREVGYPVVLKAQAAALSHKSDAGGVILNIADDAALEAAWHRLYGNVAAYDAGIALDGAQVEAMGERGVELIVGARNDPDWGPVILVGFGGVTAELLHDVRLLPIDLTARGDRRRTARAQAGRAARRLSRLARARRRGRGRADRRRSAGVLAGTPVDPRDRSQPGGRLSPGRRRGRARCADPRRLGASQMDVAKLKAIDIHVHAEVSCHDPEDPIFAEFLDASTRYFKTDRRRPTIPETIAHYREREIGFVMFTVDMEAGTGIKRIRNEEIAEAAAANSDIMIAFASIDPHKGKRGAIEARDLIEKHGVKGFKFHPPLQNFDPGDRMAWPLYEVIDHYKLPAIFHTGHSGMGTGMPGGGGIRLKYGQPMLVDEVAVDFPDIKIILAHPGWPWTDESLSMALHKPNVFIDLSGWSPKYFPPQIVRYANTPARPQIPVRVGLSADPARQVDRGLRRGGVQARASRPDSQGQCGQLAWPLVDRRLQPLDPAEQVDQGAGFLFGEGRQQFLLMRLDPRQRFLEQRGSAAAQLQREGAAVGRIDLAIDQFRRRSVR